MSWRMFLDGSAHGYVGEIAEMLRSSTVNLDKFGCHEMVKNSVTRFMLRRVYFLCTTQQVISHFMN